MVEFPAGVGCGGSGALEFYDCEGNCISDIDNDGLVIGKNTELKTIV